MDRNAQIRVTDFAEVDLGLSRDEIVAEAQRCIQCKKPKCISGCPVGIDIPAFIAAIAEEKFQEAVDIIKRDNMLPAVCGRVCPQESQCQGVCILGLKAEPIAIGQLERYVADFERAQAENCENPEEINCPVPAPATGKYIAVVGSGPAGLSAAAELARRGHSVTIFESLHEAGGVLMYGIPAFRMPKDIVQFEIDQVKRLGVEIKTNHIVGRSVSVEELLAYDAVFLGTGAGLPYFMGIPGENLPGVYSANEFLTRVNLMGANRFPEMDTPVKVGKKVVVIGGGNVAMDAARVARRMGAEVTLMYRRSEADMPARRDEVRHAKEEGVIFMTATNPIAFLGENNAVCGVEAIKMELGTAGDDGRCSFYPIEGSAFKVEADVIVEAIGQGPNPLLLRMMPDLTRNRNGSVAVNCLGETSMPKVYAGGDVATGAATVILAMGTAKEAAISIDKKLRK
ncbi:MAG TPA: NADPH-dependent glutamate synthase [Methanocorpusculum sp.]|nr:NADPH-dependent glutamate synthase [Methanocorpusculum sp.]